MINRLANAVRSLVTRGQVTGSAVAGRTLLQIQGLDGVVQSGVEILLPPGYSARPAVGADLVLLQNLGSADHLIALGGDSIGQTIGDLAPGEFGLTNGSQIIVVRSDHVEIISPSYVTITTPTLKVTGDIIDNSGTNTKTLKDLRVAYDAHKHTGVLAGGASTGTTDHVV